MSENFGQLIYLGLLLVALGGWVMVEYRNRLGFALRTALAWGMIFLGVIAGYGLWNDLRKDLVPVQTTGENTVAIPIAADGHYYPRMIVNGQDITFMADTGASEIVLSQSDARDLGIDLTNLAYVGTANTANGTVRTARVRLDSIVFGPFQDGDIAAYVTDGQMEGSLLGMSYLGRFDITIKSEEMILTR
jgi:aspartyl protease family protein